MPAKKWIYSEDVKNKIVALYAAGVPISKMHDHYAKVPKEVTIHEWRLKYPDLAEEMEAAEKQRAQSLADASLDVVESEPDATRARIRMQARQWLAGKYNRAKFGEKVDINHNHKVEVSGVLGDATERLRSLSDQKTETITLNPLEHYEIIEQSEPSMTDNKSVDPNQLKLFEDE